MRQLLKMPSRHHGFDYRESDAPGNLLYGFIAGKGKDVNVGLSKTLFVFGCSCKQNIL